MLPLQIVTGLVLYFHVNIIPNLTPSLQLKKMRRQAAQAPTATSSAGANAALLVVFSIIFLIALLLSCAVKG